MGKLTLKERLTYAKEWLNNDWGYMVIAGLMAVWAISVVIIITR